MIKGLVVHFGDRKPVLRRCNRFWLTSHGNLLARPSHTQPGKIMAGWQKPWGRRI